MSGPGKLSTAALVVAGTATLLSAAVAEAGHPGEGTGPPPQNPRALPVQQAAEPPLLATPQEPCGKGSRPELGLQGRVSAEEHESGRAADGYTCNTEPLGQFGPPAPTGSIGGFKVERYVDEAGNECAYYDTTLLSPTNIFDTEDGVNVLDMNDPAVPQLSTRLVTPAMQSPHESLVLSEEAGILAAVTGNPAFNLGQIDVYDISEDCRAPVLRSSTPVGVLGHESGLTLDGKTFYSASPGTQTIVAVDLSNPSAPTPLWNGSYDSHGLSLSDDGNRAYIAGTGSGLIILDTTEIQQRVPDPDVPEIARLDWNSRSIPQNAIPVEIRGEPYVMEIDEFGTLSEVGAARMIDIGDETAPKVVSNLRLEVHQPENFDEISGDPAAGFPLQGYAGHYCNVPKRRNPGIVACSMILSGLRIFDVRNPRKPTEIAYFNAPIPPRVTPGFPPSNWAMASPEFNIERGEIWYSDGFSGFWSVRTTNGVWPFPRCGGRESTHSGLAKRKVGTGRIDWIVGRGGNAKVEGSGGAADRILGRGKGDRICARSGADLAKGQGGNDRIRGQRGNDTIKGGAGDDVLRGGFGTDRIIGGAGADTIDCGKGPGDVAIIDRDDTVLSGCERVERRG